MPVQVPLYWHSFLYSLSFFYMPLHQCIYLAKKNNIIILNHFQKFYYPFLIFHMYIPPLFILMKLLLQFNIPLARAVSTYYTEYPLFFNMWQCTVNRILSTIYPFFVYYAGVDVKNLQFDVKN